VTTDSNWRDVDADKYARVRADFDGDGKEDEARFLVNLTGDKYALFVSFGSGASVRLNVDRIAGLEPMGLRVLSPGKYESACGKGYWECKKGEPDVLRLSKPAVVYFQNESAESVFYWFSSAKKFRRVWLSD
jgi:hypothetical protein